MKTLTAALLATAFAASPALACGFGKSADMKTNAYTASVVSESEEAMTTFDPKEPPLFEEKTEVSNSNVETTLDEEASE